MEYKQFKEKYVTPFEGVKFTFEKDRGFIVWRVGTGNNVEILHIRVWNVKQGDGTWLLREMTKLLVECPPYHSVFVFCLGSNVDAQRAYASWGFSLSEIDGLYGDDSTVIATIAFEKLKELL